MRDLLFLSQRVPFPPDKGEKIRSWHILRHLAERFRIHLGCFFDDRKDAKYLPQLREICGEVLSLPLPAWRMPLDVLAAAASGKSVTECHFHSTELAAWVHSIVTGRTLDSIFVFSSAMTPYAIPYAQTHRVWADIVDVDSEKWRAYATSHAWPLSWLYAREQRTLLTLERQAAAACQKTFFVSQAEAALFVRLAPETSSRIGYFSNGVDLDYFNPAHRFASPFSQGSDVVVFVGTMNYSPNVEAAKWFAREVMPGLRLICPSAEFWIVGSSPSAGVRRLEGHAGVHVTGRVTDVRPYLAHAKCVVAPLRIARGVQNKILEAMAMAKPIAATPDACEGLLAAPDEIIRAEQPADFVSAVSSVIAGAQPGLGGRARARAEASYRWSQNLEHLDQAIANSRDLIITPTSSLQGSTPT